MLVSAGAGVFLVFAFAAIGEIDVETFGDGFGVGSDFDLEDDRRIFISGGERLIRYQPAVFRAEGEFRRAAAIAAGRGDGLFLGWDGFEIIADERDLDFAFRGDEEFEMGFDGLHDVTAVGPGDLFLVIMIVIMFIRGE